MSDKGRKAFEKGAALLEKGEAAASLAYLIGRLANFRGSTRRIISWASRTCVLATR